jgi:hypothetical protein
LSKPLQVTSGPHRDFEDAVLRGNPHNTTHRACTVELRAIS